MLRARRLIVLLLVLSAAAGLQAADDISYIKAGTLVDVNRGRSLVNQVIVVQGDKIMRVAAAADISIPTGANIIDLSGKTVLPGLIDMHAHLTGDHRFHGYSSLGISVPRETLYGVPRCAR